MCQSTETAVNDAFCRTLTRKVWLFRNAILFRNGLRMLDFNYITRSINRVNVLRSATVGVHCSVQWIPSYIWIRSRYDDLVTGGARSGKSRHAEVLIGDLHRFCISLPRKSLMMRWLHDRTSSAKPPGALVHSGALATLDELIHADINPNEAVLLECVPQWWLICCLIMAAIKTLMNGLSGDGTGD